MFCKYEACLGLPENLKVESENSWFCSYRLRAQAARWAEVGAAQPLRWGMLLARDQGILGGFSKAGEVAVRGQVESLLAEELSVRECCFYTMVWNSFSPLKIELDQKELWKKMVVGSWKGDSLQMLGFWYPCFCYDYQVVPSLRINQHPAGVLH